MAVGPNTAKLTAWTHLVNEGSLPAVYSSNNAKAEKLASVCQSSWHYEICHLLQSISTRCLSPWFKPCGVCLIPMSVMLFQKHVFFLDSKAHCFNCSVCICKNCEVFLFLLMLFHCRVCHGQGFNYHTAQRGIFKFIQKSNKAILVDNCMYNFTARQKCS